MRVWLALHPTWNLAVYNNARDYRGCNSRYIYCRSFRKCRQITRYQFSSINLWTRQVFRWRIASWRACNCSRIWYYPLMNYKMICAMVSTCSTIFRRSRTYSYEKIPFHVNISNSLSDNIENSERSIFNCTFNLINFYFYRDMTLVFPN